MNTRTRLGIVFGGVSSEHEVSLASAKNVLEAIDRSKFDVTEIGILKDGRWVIGDGALVYLVCNADGSRLPVGMDQVITGSAAAIAHREGVRFGQDNLAQELGAHLGGKLTISRSRLPEPSPDGRTICDLDVVFPVLHGAMGEDGAIQGLLSIADIAVVGCGILSSSLCLDKLLAKEVLAHHRIPQARWLGLLSHEALADPQAVAKTIEAKLGGYPVFLKPANGGSSVGVVKIKSASEVPGALSVAAKYDRKLIIEEYIQGREVEIAVLGLDGDLTVCPVASEIIPEREFYDYEAKYLDGGTRIELPANLPEGVVERMQELARAAFRAVDGSGLSRIDFFYRESSDELFLNEINTIPGFTQISQYPALMKTAGYSYRELIEALIAIALKRHEQMRALTI